MIRRFVALAMTIGLFIAFTSSAMADDGSFRLGRFVTCLKVVSLEPVGLTDSFKEDTKKVYAFIEAFDIEEDTTIKIQWLYSGKETALIELTLKKGQRWRTYSSKRIGIRYGNWEIRLLDGQDNLVKSISFTVK